MYIFILFDSEQIMLHDLAPDFEFEYNLQANNNNKIKIKKLIASKIIFYLIFFYFIL